MRTCSRRRASIVPSLFAVLLLLPGLTAWAAEAPPPRAWAPVQYGFQPNAPLVPAHATDHVLVQLAADAYRISRVPRQLSYLQPVPGRVTGLANLDRTFTETGVTALRRPFIVLGNKTEEQRLGLDRWLRIDIAPGTSAIAMVERLSRMAEIQNATLDYIAFPEVIPPDPMHAMHWGHNNTHQLLSYNWANNNHETGSPVGTVGFDTNAQAAWDGTQGFGSSSVIIAIIDSGVQAAHPDLLQVTGWDFGDNDSNPDDNSSQAGHGTACSGVAAARTNSLGTAGIAAGCSIMPLKVANSAGTMTFTSIQNALMYAADHGANVISMSLGAAITSDPATDNAITYAWNAGCVILAATGNENKSTISYPAIHSLVIGVGAASPCGDRKRSSSSSSEVNPGVSTDPNGYTCDGERWWGSNYGTTTAGAAGAVDVLAPTILPTTDRLGAAGYDPSDYSKWFNGTSCATPYAAGVCALIKSKNPSWTNAQIRDQLRNTAQDVVSVESAAGWDRYAGYGMVDAAAAVGGGGGGGDVITVTAPNGGETLTAGASTTITWTWSGSFATVNIDYSTNGGGTWTSIATGTANDGSQAWTVPSTATTQGRVRVSGGTATDMSNANFTISVPSGSYATLPYTTSFSSTFDQYWQTAVTNEGRVQLLTTSTPHSGTHHMVMDDAVSGGNFSQTEARLRLNLSGQTQVALSFWWKDFGDETHTQDGVYFSNNGGSSYVKVFNLNGGSFSDNTWRLQSLDLDALAASAGLTLTSTFVVKFQQYDDYPVATDGFAIDDISVTAVGGGGGGITAESESNNTSGTADGPLGTALGCTGAISSSSDQDWFFFDVTTPGNLNVNLAIGSSADLDWFLYNSALTEVARGYSTANPEVGNYNATATGRYYVMVDGYLSAISSYTLTINGGLANDIPLQKAFDAKPVVTDLLPNVPNPFRGGTSFQFALARGGHVSLDVFDAGGRLVTRVADREFDAGVHKLEWDGRRDNEKVSPGVYFYRFTTPGFSQTRKMIVLPG